MIKTNCKTGSLSVILIFISLLLSCNQQPEQNITETLPAGENIILSEAQIQLANIKVSEVNEGFIGHNLLFTGVLKVNETSAINISSRAAGRIQKLFFRNTGEKVNIGDSLYQFYGEDLVTAQRAYSTLQNNNWNSSGRYEPSLALENKLLLLGMLPSQIEQLRKDGKITFIVTIYSPVKGIIRSINVTEGQYIDAGQSLFELAEDNKLWAEAQVYQDDLQFLNVGTPTTVIVPVAGDKIIASKISFINPSFEPGRNITLIRSVIDNPDRELHPGMLALMNVETKRISGTLIPVSAVIVDKEGSLVWIQEENGSFAERRVTTGIQSADSVLILSGLSKSEKVVISGTYLLNSEMILKKGSLINEDSAIE